MENKNKNANAITESELDAILGKDSHSHIYHANHLIADKVIFPKSAYFGKKGESYMTMTNGVEQWNIKIKGTEDFIRVKWYVLESNVSDGSYGSAKYIGLNPSIYGKVGELSYKAKKWVFTFDGEDYNLNSPDSVELQYVN